MNIIFRRYIALLIVTIFFSACSPGRRLATRFVETEDKINVLLLQPAGVIKKYYPFDPYSANVDSVYSAGIGWQVSDSVGQDSHDVFTAIPSFPIEDSYLLKELNDSALLLYYFRSLQYHLERFQIRVYSPANINMFFTLDTIGFIFSTVQVELLEYLNEFKDYYTGFDENNYVVNLQRRNLELNTWLEYSELNNPERSIDVLYSLQSSSDFFQGRFYIDLRGEVYYPHDSYYLEPPDMYDLAFNAGKTNAQYIFDFLMNRYVLENLKRPRKSMVYFQYDPDQLVVRRAGINRFIRITMP